MLATDMSYVVSIYMHIAFYIQRIAHLTCATHVAFALCIVAVLSPEVLADGRWQLPVHASGLGPR